MTIAFDSLTADALPILGGGPPDADNRPVLRFDTITVSDEAAAVAGSVTDWLALTSELSINGQYVPLDNQGRFFAVVRLAGYDGISFWLDAGIHGEVSLDLPLKAG